jgi:UDP-N-acetylglucosamine 2-epimerase (non-hydrolysing)
MMPFILCTIAGARPNFIKAAALHQAFKRYAGWVHHILYTGQHREASLSTELLPGMELPLNQLSPANFQEDVLSRLKDALLQIRPQLVIVPGDTDSALAGARAAAHLGIPIAHVEAGLRSFDDSMPEERNRIEIDRLAQFHFATEPAAVDNLLYENIPSAGIHLVGNVMIDLLYQTAPGSPPFPEHKILATFHRPSNVDTPEGLERLLNTLSGLQAPVLWPLHPRTRDRLSHWGLQKQTASIPQLRLCPPLPYPDFVRQLRHSRLVITDSGGLQEESTALGIPCITFRRNTERPITVELGSNILAADLQPETVQDLAPKALSGNWMPVAVPLLWDGKAADRIAQIIQKASVTLHPISNSTPCTNC